MAIEQFSAGDAREFRETARATTARIPRRRWGIGLLLGLGVLVNFIDRITLSVAGPQLQEQFALTPQQTGLLLSAFFWSYALLQIPTGMLLDRFGVRLVGRISAFLWSVASGVIALAGGFGGILAARVLLGIAEAPGFPASSKATGYWFPRCERGRAAAIFDAAAKFSNVVGVPLTAFAVVKFGWRWGFGLSALLSFAYFVAFYFAYRDPSADRGLSRAEYTYIKTGGATSEGPSDAGTWSSLGYLLSNVKVWGLTIGFSAYGYSFYMFLTWLPGYLVKTMHMDILKSAGYAAVPWACATVSDLVIGGWLVDFLISKGRDETKVRKGVLVIGMLFGLAVFGATATQDPRRAILWISIALSGLAAAAPIGWSIPSLIAPKGGTATVGGIMNFSNNMMGAIAPIVTGWIVGATNSFTGAFAVAGVVLVVGIIAFVFMLGRIEQIPDPPTAGKR